MGAAHHPEKDGEARLHLVHGGGFDEEGGEKPVARPRRRCPLWRVLADVGLTVLHYSLGTALVLVTYRFAPALAWPLAAGYLVFAAAQRWLFMPLVVCSSCVYSGVRDGRCPCGNNVLAARLSRLSAVTDGFATRTRGALSPSRLDRASFVAPLLLALPGLLLTGSGPAVSLAVVVALLLALRVALIRPLDCAACLEQRWCPVGRKRVALR